MIDVQKEVEEILKNAEKVLANTEHLPFSSSAFELLKAKIGEYISMLVAESSKVSKRYKADSISAVNVERASEYLLTSSSRRFFRHLGTVGGILLGASLSNFLSMATTNQYATMGILVSAGLGIVGAFLIALNIAKD